MITPLPAACAVTGCMKKFCWGTSVRISTTESETELTICEMCIRDSLFCALRQVEVLLHLGDVDMRRAGQTVIAVHAPALHRIFWGGGEDEGIVPLPLARRLVGGAALDLLRGLGPG